MEDLKLEGPQGGAGSQAEAEDQGREAMEGLFLLTLGPRASQLVRLFCTGSPSPVPVPSQSSRASATQPLSKPLCQPGGFSFQLRTAGRVSRTLGAQKRTWKGSPRPSCLVLSGSLLCYLFVNDFTIQVLCPKHLMHGLIR